MSEPGGWVDRVADSGGRGSTGDYLRAHQEVTVGLIGPHALLERIVLAAGLPSPSAGILRVTAADSDEEIVSCRLLPAAYADEHTAPDKVARLGAVDACLFASPAPLAYARHAGVLSSPAVHIQLADGPLIAALLRAGRASLDPARASFDTFSRLDVTHALAETGVTAHRVHVREEIASPAALASYHARLWQLGQTSAAVTCLDEVARRLTAGGVPVVTVRPSDHAVATALRAAILLAEQRALAAAQLAVILIEVPGLRDYGSGRTSRQAREELRLAVHGLLVHEARQFGAAVSPVSDHGFLVLATSGSLAGLPDGDLPFAAAAAQRLDVGLDVAVGTGRSEREAEEAARRRLDAAVSAGPSRRTRGRQRPPARLSVAASGRPGPAAGLVVQPRPGAPMRAADRPGGARAGSAPASLSRLRSLETLALLAQKLAADATPVVDAELTGQLLSVTPRTARRQLRALADEGLALPLPPRRSPHPGRPRQSYRLVVEKLDRTAVP